MPRVANKEFIKNRPTRHCASEGCAVATNDGKPYCPDHVLEEGYAKDLAAVVDAAYDEVVVVSKRGTKAIDVNGLVVGEILDGLAAAGEVTWRRLVKDRVAFLNGADAETADYYLAKLRKEKLVIVSLNKRSSEVVALTLAGLKRARKRA